MNRKQFSAGAGVLALALAAWASHASAAITYVDATAGAGGNTTLTGGGQWDPLASQSFVNDDGVWESRAFGNGGSIDQNAASGGVDNAHRLLSTIGGLTSGSDYHVYVYFWSDVSSWRVNAGHEDLPELPQFSAVGSHGDPATANTTRLGPGTSDNLAAPLFSTAGDHFTTSVMIGEGNRRLYEGYLGTGTAGTGGTIQVWIDDDPPVMADSNQRTWYEGVGYQLVPEPATGALGGLALLTLGVVHRRQRG